MIERIALVGLPASGKSTLGAALAERCGYRFIDLDAQIEASTGRTIPEIFKNDGEARFRELESSALQALSSDTGILVATGGGVVERQDNRDCLQNRFYTIWLDIAPELAAARAQGSQRPLLAQDPLARMIELYTRRKPYYKACSTYTLKLGTEIQDTLVALLAQVVLSAS